MAQFIFLCFVWFVITASACLSNFVLSGWDRDAKKQAVSRSGRGSCPTATSKHLQPSQCVHCKAHSCCSNSCIKSTVYGISLLAIQWILNIFSKMNLYLICIHLYFRVITSPLLLLRWLHNSSLLCHRFLPLKLLQPTLGLVGWSLLLMYCHPVRPALPWDPPTPNILLWLQVWPFVEYLNLFVFFALFCFLILWQSFVAFPRFPSSPAIPASVTVHCWTSSVSTSRSFYASCYFIRASTATFIVSCWRPTPHAQPRGATNKLHATYLLRLCTTSLPAWSPGSSVPRKPSQPGYCTSVCSLCSSWIWISTGWTWSSCCKALPSSSGGSSSYWYEITATLFPDTVPHFFSHEFKERNYRGQQECIARGDLHLFRCHSFLTCRILSLAEFPVWQPRWQG